MILQAGIVLILGYWLLFQDSSRLKPVKDHVADHPDLPRVQHHSQELVKASGRIAIDGLKAWMETPENEDLQGEMSDRATHAEDQWGVP